MQRCKPEIKCVVGELQSVAGRMRALSLSGSSPEKIGHRIGKNMEAIIPSVSMSKFPSIPPRVVCRPASAPVSPLRAIAMILAHGVLRLQARQKALDTRTEQRVHDPVLNPKGDTA